MPSNTVDRRTFLKLSGGAAATMALAGCTGGDTGGTTTTTDSGGTGTTTDTTTTAGGGQQDFDLTITQGSLPAGLDPHDHRETPTEVVMLHVYEGVLTRDADGKILESLATEWERVEGENAITFQLRDGVTFHNGDELTPEDVAYSINRIVDDEVGFASPQSDQLAGVTGAEAMDGAVRVMNDGLNPIVFSEFATYCDIMQQSWVEDRSQAEIAGDMNGTGPFQLESYTEDEEVVLIRYDDYWQEPAAAASVTFRGAAESSTRVNQLLAGETDIVVNVPPQEVQRVNDSDNATIAAAPSTRLLFNALRYDVEPFSSKEFRQALNYAVDLNSIIQNVLGGFGGPTSQPTLPNFVGYNPDLSPYEYDPERAAELVEQSGHAGVEIEMHTPVGRYLKDLEIAEAVAGFINDLPNVTATVRQRDFGSLVDELLTGNIEDKPPWYLIGWGEATFDGGLVMTALLKSDGALTTFSNEELDQLLTRAGNEEGDTRAQTLMDANALCHEEAPWIFLNQQYSVYGVNSALNWEARADERIDAYAITKN
ncbi:MULTISPECIES: ABC transporter substrate-binding protein [unclassified Haladaptatus]|uniref:ABC transporter substrate-binding protein n=1 Tax=unclassified Haladaptatus TaxID=2622732 RepID=UPI0023E88F04|nr:MULTISPECIES: ABC transporter substrate-binding protein [unclassified Haladaptatus]